MSQSTGKQTGTNPADGSEARPTAARQDMLQLARNWASGGRTAAASAATPARDPGKTDFTTLPGYKEIRKYQAVADVIGVRSPFFKVHETRSGATCQIDGRSLVNFVSYDYLGLNGSPEVSDAAAAAIGDFGTSASASRPTAGSRPVHRALEAQLAALYETDDALTFVSGHGTNVSVVGELLGRADLVLFDALSHNSIVVGTKLSSATRQSFPHNDIAALDKILRDSRHRFDRVLIVVEGLYSMDGDVALLPELIEIKKRYNAWLMVDEAHSLGVLGPTGRGVFEHFGVPPGDVDIWMGTLSKTLSGCGGYIAGCQALIDNLKFNASAFMYSVGMSPPLAAAALAALQKMQAEPERVERLRANGTTFLACCRSAGLDVGHTEGHAIGVVIVGDSLRATALSQRLAERGVNAFPVTYPAVPMRGARLRFFLTSEHTKAQIENSVEIVREELDRLKSENFGLSSAATGAQAAYKYLTG